MEIKDCTETVGGCEVRIYSTDGAGPYPIHGAIDGEVFRWTTDGRAVRGMNTLRDLKLTDWRDEIRWDCLVDEIQWVARDEDGEWLGHKREPLQMADAWVTSTYHYSLEAIKMPAGPADWRHAIAQRPEGR